MWQDLQRLLEVRGKSSTLGALCQAQAGAFPEAWQPEARGAPIPLSTRRSPLHPVIRLCVGARCLLLLSLHAPGRWLLSCARTAAPTPTSSELGVEQPHSCLLPGSSGSESEPAHFNPSAAITIFVALGELTASCLFCTAGMMIDLHSGTGKHWAAWFTFFSWSQGPCSFFIFFILFIICTLV